MKLTQQKLEGWGYRMVKLSLSSPFPSRPLSSLPFTSPPLHFPPFSALSFSPSLRSRALKIQLGGLGAAIGSTSGSGPPKDIVKYFTTKVKLTLQSKKNQYHNTLSHCLMSLDALEWSFGYCLRVQFKCKILKRPKSVGSNHTWPVLQKVRAWAPPGRPVSTPLQ